MNTEQVLQVIGQEIDRKIISGRFGDVAFHTAGFAVGDPCYWHDDTWYDQFCAGARIHQPNAYNGTERKWVSFPFGDQIAFFKTCGDGVGPLGHCVDAGWIVAVPIKACPDRVQKLFESEVRR